MENEKTIRIKKKAWNKLMRMKLNNDFASLSQVIDNLIKRRKTNTVN